MHTLQKNTVTVDSGMK